MNLPIEITKQAQKEINHIMENKNIPSEYGLRIGVKGGGCSVSFVLGFDKEKANDKTFQVGDIPVFIQKGELMFLVGKQVDFYEGSDARGFVFVDPSTIQPK
ncbi:MAG: iron-sulfur cluster assembly accessory protein [Cyclobacteriaceae bacterium]